MDYPPDNYYNDTQEIMNITFNATVTDDFGLRNCSLWNDISGVFKINQTVDVSGLTSTVVEFNLTELINVTFIWNIGCYDDVNGFNFSGENRTVLFNYTNTLPTHTRPILNATSINNLTTDNLTCYNQSSYDPDGDYVNNIFNWYKDGTSITLLNMPFEGGSTSTATNDYSGYGNNGAVTAATWNGTGGHDGNGAYEFPGSGNAYVELDSDKTGWNFTTAFTISAWIKTRSNPVNERGIVTRNNLPPYPWTFRFDGGYLEWNFGGNLLQYAWVPTIGQWYHVVALWNSTHRIMYIDGIAVNNKSSSAPTIGYDKVHIGQDFTTSSQRVFDGTIDDVMIFNTTLSEEQIGALYTNKTDTIVSQETSIGETWQCEITPNDGQDNGIALRSSNLTILNSQTVLTDAAWSYEQDGGWGEEWNFTVNLTEPDIQYINVSLYLSKDNSTWTLVNSTNVTCPCDYRAVKFTKDPAWNETDIGTAYFQFRADDYGTGYDNISANVTVERDDVNVIVFSGSGITIDRNGTAIETLQVNITDTDNDLPVDTATNCSLWVTTDGSSFGTRMDNTTQGSICTYGFDPDNNYQVGVQNWTGGVYNDTDYKNTNLTYYANITLKGTMDIELETPVSYTSDKYQAITNITFRWNITGDALENVAGVSNILELNNQNGTYDWFEACNSTNTNNEGNGWYNCTWTLPYSKEEGIYEARVNANKQYYYNASENFSNRFEVLTNPPVL
ncbi:LamG domain-containing protein, partial [Nanoarchaeota archaeon]